MEDKGIAEKKDIRKKKETDEVKEIRAEKSAA